MPCRRCDRPASRAAARPLEETASGLALVTAAIALWNTLYLDRALNDLRCGGEMIPEALLAHLAPVGWQPINLTGDYLWDADIGPRSGRVPSAPHDSNKPSPDGLLPDRVPDPVQLTVLSCPFYGVTPVLTSHALQREAEYAAYLRYCCNWRCAASVRRAEGSLDAEPLPTAADGPSA